MGTSKSYGGPASGLVPSFVDSPASPVLSKPPVASPLIPATPSLPVTPTVPDGLPRPEPVSPAPPLPAQPDAGGTGGLGLARRSFSRFARTGSRNALGRALSHYVRHGTGSARHAARRMGSSKATATGLLSVVRDHQQLGPTAVLRQLNLSGLSGRPAADVFLAMLEFFCPPGGAIDEAIARQAMLDTIGDMADSGVGNFDTLTSTQLRDFFLDFIARSIEARVMADLGRRGITLPNELAAVEYAQAQLHDFVTGATRGQLRDLLDGVERLSDEQLETTVDEIYEAAFELVAAAGEAVA